MKKIVIISTILLFLVRCKSAEIIRVKPNTQKTTIKTYINKEFTFNYPSSWVEHHFHKRLNFSPIKAIEKDFQSMLHFSIFQFRKKLPSQSLKDIVAKSMEQNRHAYKKLKQNLGILKKNGRDVYIVKKTSVWERRLMSEITYYYENKGIIYFVEFSAPTKFYNQYFDEASILLNSFKFIE